MDKFRNKDTALGICGELADRIENLLHQAPSALPSIAAKCIDEVNACARLDALNIFDELAQASLPPTILLENDFGLLVVSLVRRAAFRIELSFWNKGSEAYVHNHIASGAFAVVRGERVHAEFAFDKDSIERDENINDVQPGTLRLKHASICSNNSICEVPAGDKLIHSFFYLDDSCVTLTVKGINEQNTIRKENKVACYIPLDTHYLPRLALKNGAIGSDSRKITSFLKICEKSNNLSQKLLVDIVENKNLSHVLGAIASDENFAIDSSDIVERIKSVLMDFYAPIAGHIRDSVDWFGDRSRYLLISDALPDHYQLAIWLMLLGCSDKSIIDLMNLATKNRLIIDRVMLGSIVDEVLSQEYDDGAGPQPVFQSTYVRDIFLGYKSRLVDGT